MSQFLKSLALVSCALLMAGCASKYSPNIYSSNAVQLANKVETGVVVGYREVAITSSGTVGAVTGGAVGGVLGSQYADSALVAVGATTVGAYVGETMDHALSDTAGWEYIIRKSNGDMLSVTQREKKPLGLGQKVLVIMGPQARVVPDYSTPPNEPSAVAVKDKAETKVESPVKVEVVLTLPPGISAQPTNDQVVAVQTSSDSQSLESLISGLNPSTAFGSETPGALVSVLSDDASAKSAGAGSDLAH